MTADDPHTNPLTTAQLRELDRLASAEYGIPGVVLMENAGAGAAKVALALIAQSVGARVVIACGPGQNGGDGWVVARHLAHAGCDVRVGSTVALDALRGDAAIHARAAVAMGIAHEVVDGADALGRWSAVLDATDLVVDALLGTGTSGAPRGAVLRAIESFVARRARAAPPRVLALDLPSGLDADSGERPGPCVRADATATFAARKRGFDAPGAADFTGIVHVIDLGVPRALLDRVRGLGG